jgi:hypothetical protein
MEGLSEVTLTETKEKCSINFVATKSFFYLLGFAKHEHVNSST